MQRWRTAAAGDRGCYSNDIFPEAGERGISVRKVKVTVCADRSGEPVSAQNIPFDVEADATRGDTLDLNRRTDRVVEIPNSSRCGTAVKPAELKAIPHR